MARHTATVALLTSGIDARNDRNADQLAARFEKDAEFVNVSGLWWHDRGAIHRAHADGFDTILSELKITLLEKQVKWISGRPEDNWNALPI
jgi:uncharacterized protein (TIGR02246 family)